MLDTLGAGLKKLLQKGKERGYVTVDELSAALPAEEVTSEQIEDTMAMISEMGINLVDSEETEDVAEEKPAATDGKVAVAASEVEEEEDYGRTDDPVRMYLREMGSVELLSREGEIAIAKRIEAGREAMIAGLCESPLTFTAIIVWRDELNEDRILLRDIIDLEATYAAARTPSSQIGQGGDANAPSFRQGPRSQEDIAEAAARQVEAQAGGLRSAAVARRGRGEVRAPEAPAEEEEERRRGRSRVIAVGDGAMEAQARGSQDARSNIARDQYKRYMSRKLQTAGCGRGQIAAHRPVRRTSSASTRRSRGDRRELVKTLSLQQRAASSAASNSSTTSTSKPDAARRQADASCRPRRWR